MKYHMFYVRVVYTYKLYVVRKYESNVLSDERKVALRVHCTTYMCTFVPSYNANLVFPKRK
jgi:hypothetical protein